LSDQLSVWWAVAIEGSSVLDEHGDLPVASSCDQDGVDRGRALAGPA